MSSSNWDEFYSHIMSQDIPRKSIDLVLKSYNKGADSEHSISKITGVDARTARTVLIAAKQYGLLNKDALEKPMYRLSTSDFLRHIAQEVEEKTEKEKKPEKGRAEYIPEEVRVYFSAKPPEKPSTETISEEGNFTWGKGFGIPGYEFIFRKGDSHYIYELPITPWGLRDVKGTAEVSDADPNITEADITPSEVEKIFSKIVKKPLLYPPGLRGYYINTDKSDPEEGKKIPYAKFDQKYRKSGFYKVVSKTKKLENP